MVAIVVVVIVVAPYALAIIVDFVARGTVAESEPKLGVNKTPWWPFIEPSIPTLGQIIADTAQQQNKWDDSPEGLTLKTMKCAVATQKKRRRLVVASQDVSSLSLSSPVTPLPHIFPIKN